MSEGQELRLEKNEVGSLVGRLYVEGRRTSAYVEYTQETAHLFSPAQVRQLEKEMF